MNFMNAVDTNILIYVQDPRDPAKQKICADLLKNLVDQVLLYQVACEFLAASRKLVPFGYSLDQSFQDIDEMSRLIGIVLPSAATFRTAQSFLSSYSLSFWDAMVIAACQEAGVAQLYSEDFDAYPLVGAVNIINPFKP
jgi:predicted nucleic acid-binding protein